MHNESNQQTHLRRTLRSGASFLLVLVFSFQLGTRAFYSHLHLLPDGSAVTHAHPYDKTNGKDPGASHTHKSSFLLLSHILDIFFPLVLLSIPIAVHGKEIVRISSSPQGLIRAFRPALPGRSPPFMI